MTSVDPLLAALDRRPTPLRFLARDDDAGWDNPRLWALLDTMARSGVPIDLAVIPQATDGALARELAARFDAVPAALGLHQHGFAHTNHETTGRKCEFGPARAPAQQRRDLAEGRVRLSEFFGERLDPIFTPPWNRCTSATPALLAELGFAALSRDAGAPPQDALAEIPVHVDWCKERRGDPGGASIIDALVRHAGNGATVGLMLHHAAMDDTDLGLLAAWLTPVARHPNIRCTKMREAMSGM